MKVTLFVDTICPIYLVSPSMMYFSWKALLFLLLKFLRFGNFLKMVIFARLRSSYLFIKHYNNLKEYMYNISSRLIDFVFVVTDTKED